MRDLVPRPGIEPGPSALGSMEYWSLDHQGSPQHVHYLTHWAPEKIVLWRKQYFWKLSPMAADKVYAHCTICPKS